MVLYLGASYLVYPEMLHKSTNHDQIVCKVLSYVLGYRQRSIQLQSQSQLKNIIENEGVRQLDHRGGNGVSLDLTLGVVQEVLKVPEVGFGGEVEVVELVSLVRVVLDQKNKKVCLELTDFSDLHRLAHMTV